MAHLSPDWRTPGIRCTGVAPGPETLPTIMTVAITLVGLVLLRTMLRQQPRGLSPIP